MKSKRVLALLIFTYWGFLAQVMAQSLKGDAIQGLRAGDRAGCSVSMPNAYTLAVGAYFFDSMYTDAGQARVYQWNGQTWKPKGAYILGEAADDRCGNAVSMPDSNTLGVGALLNDGNGFERGHVRIFTWDGNNWVQKGDDIDGESDSSRSGNSIAMPNANTIAIGAYGNNGLNGAASGHVRVFIWNGNAWIQKGADIDGASAGDFSGNSVSMPDSNTVAIGALLHDGNGADAGQVRVWLWSGTDWKQKGEDILGIAPDDRAGWAVFMPDKNTVAVGAPYHDGNGSDAGIVNIYEWNGAEWKQKGNSLYGQSAGDRAGWSIRMPNANMIAFGCSGSDANGLDAGQVKIFEWNGNTWIQKGIDINGATAGDRSGWSLSMPDINTLAIGAPFHASNGTEAGHARVFGSISTALSKPINQTMPVVYPNPSNGIINLLLNEVHPRVEVVIFNNVGKEMYRQSFSNVGIIMLSQSFPPGIYLAEINIDNKQLINKLIVN